MTPIKSNEREGPWDRLSLSTRLVEKFEGEFEGGGLSAEAFCQQERVSLSAWMSLSHSDVTPL